VTGTPHSINQKRRISGIKIAPENRSLEGQKWYQSVFFLSADISVRVGLCL
jgi:hypothetical protein